MLEPCAVKVASTVLRRGLHREMGFLSDYATATGLSAMMDNEISHDQVTRFLSKNEFTSKEL